MTVWGVVPAAGSGRRFGGDKVQALLGDRPLWQWSRDALVSGGAQGVVVVGPVPGGVPGGDRRRDSVAAGLDHVPDEAEFVLVHDAARPLATPQLVASVIARLRQGDPAGVVPVLAVPDTVKRVTGEQVVETLDRTTLRLAQTPQGFRRDILVEAHRSVPGGATDDAVLVEAAGHPVVVIPGEAANLKITGPADLRIAEALLP